MFPIILPTSFFNEIITGNDTFNLIFYCNMRNIYGFMRTGCDFALFGKELAF